MQARWKGDFNKALKYIFNSRLRAADGNFRSADYRGLVLETSIDEKIPLRALLYNATEIYPVKGLVSQIREGGRFKENRCIRDASKS